ncbi:hypothetical protein EON65_51835 [archaeon]|nr:MAG: hypothetical protein EON65_51835 [archaeon]
MSERKQLGSLLTTRIGLVVLQTGCSLFGIIAIAAHSQIPCDQDFQAGVRIILVGVVAASQLLDGVLFICCGSCLLRYMFCVYDVYTCIIA